MNTIATSGHRFVTRTIDDARRMARAAQRVVDRIGAGRQATGENALLLAGGATGWDIALLEAYDSVRGPFEIHLPFPKRLFTSYWRETDCERLDLLLPRARQVIVYGTEAQNRLYLARNQAMVDRADEIIVFWDGRKKGGTWATVRMGLKRGIPCFNVFDGWAEISKEVLARRCKTIAA